MDDGTDSSFFLFIGSSMPEGVANKLKATNVMYRRKSLYSYRDNWRRIVAMLESPHLKGAVVKLTSQNYRQMLSPDYSDTANDLFARLGAIRHLVLVHESLLAPTVESPVADTQPQSEAAADDEYPSYLFVDDWESYFDQPDPDEVSKMTRHFEQHSIDVAPYMTNSELDVLASAFVEQAGSGLLFRVYVPSTQLWASETDKIVQLLHDWLTRVKGRRVRRGGYRTGQGAVYEFYNEDSTEPAVLSTDVDEFNRFVDLCLHDPPAAGAMLEGGRLSHQSIASVVERYTKEVRRLQIDLKHDRETKVLAIRHRLESELVDAFPGSGLPWDLIERTVDALVPAVPDTPAVLGQGVVPAVETTMTVNISQQYFESVRGIVTQELHGSVYVGPEASELLDLIRRFGGRDATALSAAAGELEDPDARPADRLAARQKLKAFIFKIRDKVGAAAFDVLQKYVESKLNL